ncbi:hypothetical protein AB0I35_30010 [Nocardia sp. NPDC050378]|uniref:alpha/beta hydrolase n=1 Tax=Nocardia sp. NPDC050378 TaxID=3155400 RepID=UPI0033DE3E60
MTGEKNPHLLTRWRTRGPAPQEAPLSAILVHGRGQEADYMVDVAERIGMDDIHQLYPVAHEKSWYPHRFMEPPAVNEPSLSYALEAVAAAVGRFSRAGVGNRRIALIGFSQGACLLAEYLARTAFTPGAAVLLTGGYIGPAEDRRARGRLDGTPILLSSSEKDEWVPPGRVRETSRLFEDMGAAVSTRIHDTAEHTVGDEEIVMVRDLLRELRGN